MAGTAISKKAEMNFMGGRLEIWSCSIDPASVAAAAQGIETVAIPGARASDPCWASASAPVANLILAGAKVTADDVVSVYFDNNITVTTALDSVAGIVFIFILKLAV